MQSAAVPFFKTKRARVRLSWVMILIAFIAVGSRVPAWLDDAVFTRWLGGRHTGTS